MTELAYFFLGFFAALIIVAYAAAIFYMGYVYGITAEDR